jgi:hypothetical protein
MSIFSDVVDVAKDVGKAVVNTVSDAVDSIADTIFGSDTEAVKHGMAPGDLVKTIQGGPGLDDLQWAQQTGVAQSGEQQQIEQQSRQMATDLESAWTGNAADAAREQIMPLVTTAASASDTLHGNANIVQDQIHQFTALKSALHTDVTNNAPEKSTWDSVTPWDTDTEDLINARNQKVQENLDRYNTYAQQSTTNAPAMKIDYGQLDNSLNGDFSIKNQPTAGKVQSRIDTPTMRPPSSRPLSSRPPANRSQAPVPTASDTHQPGTQSGQPGQPGQPGYQPTTDDSTRAAIYVPPANYPGQGQSFGPGGYGPTGGYQPGNYPAGGYGPIGFGPGGTSGFGGTGGPGNTGEPGTGARTGAGPRGGVGPEEPGRIGQGPGKSTGSGMSEAARSGAGRAGAPGAAGKGGAGMPGAMGGGRGKGDDEEHQRASYLTEPDPESLFGADPSEKTVPPVIGQ